MYGDYLQDALLQAAQTLFGQQGFEGTTIRYIGEDDPTTRRMLESILAVEEEHAEDLKTLIEALPHDARASRPS